MAPVRGFFVLIGLMFLVAVMPFGTLLTLVSKARGDAARVRSTNNLKQIALGFHAHNDAIGQLPFNGGHTDPDKLKAVNYGWHNGTIKDSGTWATMILPFLEQQPIWAATAMEHKNATDVLPTYLSDPKNQTAWAVTLAVYNCPARNRQGFKTAIDKDCYPGIVTDYAINVFLNSPPKTYNPHGFATDGGVAIAGNSKALIQAIADGSSNTIMVAGKALPPSVANNNSANKWDEGIFSPGNYKAAGEKSTLTSTGTGRGHVVSATPPAADAKERPQGGGVPWLWRDSELVLTETNAIPDYSMDFGGPFAGGVVVSMADGSVRMQKYSQRGTVNLARLLYPSDGNVVTLD